HGSVALRHVQRGLSQVFWKGFSGARVPRGRIVAAQRALRDAGHRRALSADGYFSLATTNSGAHNRARLISESGRSQMARRASAAYSWARVVAASREPWRVKMARISSCFTERNARSSSTV